LNVSFKGQQILIAEDDDINFQYLINIFIAFDLCIIRARNGKEALEMGIANPFIKIILMDIMMPIMDGLESTQLLRQHNINVPIIAQTANAFESDRDKCLKAGCNDYISKPSTPEELIRIVKNYLAYTIAKSH